MNQQNQGSGSQSPADPPVKRKRGRPRKDENLVQWEGMPAPDSLKKNKQNANTGDEDEMVGQLVSGVIEGSFDAGYLLNVKVGNTDTELRGVVFLPGRFTPITAANDVAPNAKMYKRKEIHVPNLNQKSPLYDAVHPEQINKQPTEQKNKVPTLAEQTQSSNSQSGIPVIVENQSSMVMVPLADSSVKDDPGLSFGGKVVPLQISDPGLDSQPTSIKHDKALEQDGMLHEVEVCTVTKGPNYLELNKESKAEAASEPVLDKLPGIETINKESQIQHQVISSDDKSGMVNEVKSPNLELNQTPVVAKPDSIYSELPSGKPVENVTEKQASTDENIAQDIQSGDAIKISNGEGMPVMFEGDTVPSESKLESEGSVHPGHTAGLGSYSPANSSRPAMLFEGEAVPSESKLASEESVLPGHDTGLVSFSAPNLSQPAMIFEGEGIPSESKLASDGPIVPGLIQPQICSSSGAIGNMKCDINDAIPPSQS
ncbi:hypothetical protein FEM48_Zijuj01G0127800 [Ziziphus jujuba var. spinosa]|uniref:Uncharacterized protein n=1 Tax=Ziziphus jujuba var. spinosa TaxID=714518 RepID=A0A978W1C5_ZIZJJ|nr:hypothetical protein FEM48_Zijuj01G0127800 [Ziziphus jujuba var. spinosa]